MIEAVRCGLIELVFLRLDVGLDWGCKSGIRILELGSIESFLSLD